MEAGQSMEASPRIDFSESALGHVSSHVRLWIPAICVTWLDLWSKSEAFATLPVDEGKVIIPNLLEFRRSLNDGAVFGSFTGYVGVFIAASVLALGFVFYLFRHSLPRQWAMHVSLGLILAGAIGNLYDRKFIHADVVTYTSNGQQRSFIGVVADDPSSAFVRVGHYPDGGNAVTIRREDVVTIRKQGVVRDFIKFVPGIPDWIPYLGGLDAWPWVFNVADSALVVGVIVLLLQGWRDRNIAPLTSRA